jgi:hypothetical protein
MAKRFFIYTAAFIVMVFFLFVGSFPCMAKHKEDTGNLEKQTLKAPHIQFQEKIYDFGEIEPHNKVKHIFKFKNTGKGPLKITDIKAGCKCVAVTITSKETLPGGSGEIEATLDAGNYSGKISRTIIVHSNDPEEPIVRLKLQAFIKTEVIVSPQRLYFAKYEKAKPNIQKLYILEGKNVRIKVIKAEATSKYVLITAPSQITYKDKKGYLIEVGLSPDTPIGRFHANIKVHIDSKKQPVVNIPVNANVRGDIFIEPSALTLKKKL